MNTIERVRIKLGLTKPQMIRALQAKPGKVSVLTTKDESLDPALLRQAKNLETQYERWIALMKGKLIAQAGTSRDGYLHTREVARILGISDFHLSQMRIRGQVQAVPDSTRRYKYTLQQILDLIDSNSKVLGTEVRKNRGPLTNAFLAWHEENTVQLKATA